MALGSDAAALIRGTGVCVEVVVDVGALLDGEPVVGVAAGTGVGRGLGGTSTGRSMGASDATVAVGVLMTGTDGAATGAVLETRPTPHPVTSTTRETTDTHPACSRTALTAALTRRA